MTDFTSHTPSRHAARRSRDTEYVVYFCFIFLTALPFACLSCLRDSILGRSGPRPGPLTRARSEADRITPLIFSA